ncbi:hypothetical protein ACGK9R_12720 [Halomonas sp. HNIBRBA4712]|uniref:hypothetical protein n=1 Tax=Halomonas sp. HNIBRBA4712 TaxID=3373087 RepID=UPI0037471234
MREIMISHTVTGLDVMCRHCGNAETATTTYLKHFRLEGTSKDSVTLRCLCCHTAMSTPLGQLSSLYHHRAS